MTDRKTTNGELDLGQFQTLVETFGADRRRWPETSRDAAQNFLVRSSAAHEALAQARSIVAWKSAVSSSMGSGGFKSAPPPNQRFVVHRKRVFI